MRLAETTPIIHIHIIPLLPLAPPPRRLPHHLRHPPPQLPPMPHPLLRLILPQVPFIQEGIKCQAAVTLPRLAVHGVDRAAIRGSVDGGWHLADVVFRAIDGVAVRVGGESVWWWLRHGG